MDKINYVNIIQEVYKDREELIQPLTTIELMEEAIRAAIPIILAYAAEKAEIEEYSDYDRNDDLVDYKRVNQKSITDLESEIIELMELEKEEKQ